MTSRDSSSTGRDAAAPGGVAQALGEIASFERRITPTNRDRFRIRTMTVRAIGTYPLDRVVIVRNGEEVHEEKASGMETEVVWEDPAPLSKVRDRGVRGVYYYAKVYQEDGGIAWGSPVWLTCG